jgi:hypothetical protein
MKLLPVLGGRFAHSGPLSPNNHLVDGGHSARDIGRESGGRGRFPNRRVKVASVDKAWRYGEPLSETCTDLFPQRQG